MGDSTRSVRWLTIVASVAFHGALFGGLSWFAFAHRGASVQPEGAPPEASSEPTKGAPELELPTAGEGIWIESQPVDPIGDIPRVTGGTAVAHIDRGVAGRGGDVADTAPALNLADTDEHMRLSPDLLNRLDRDQFQRLRVARSRASWEDRRSTTRPAELTLVVIGPGTVRERRPESRWSPSRGALESRQASARGAELGVVMPRDEGEAGTRDGGATVGSIETAPGEGLLSSRPGRDHRASAPVGDARPDVTRAPVAMPAPERARPRDTIDSAQEVATTVRSLVHASTAGGVAGEGRGGAGGGGDAGNGSTTGAGSLARPMGLGEGDVFDYWTTDPRLVPYFRRIHAKVDPLWIGAFPKSALLDLKQGTVILELTVSADGSVVVSWPPSRPSGVEDFDRNCADAIRRAAPFPPIPPELGVRTLRIRAPFVASNPVVK